MQRIGSGFFWNQLNPLYVREGACKVHVDGAEDVRKHSPPRCCRDVDRLDRTCNPPTVVASTRKMSMPLARSETTRAPKMSSPAAIGVTSSRRSS
jgi:hypothetical protein